ncbi:calcium-binding protein, partial [Microvirga sp. 0TCS3.31]
MAILRVPQDYASVSAATANARSGDVILIDPFYRLVESVTIVASGLTIDAPGPVGLNVALAVGVADLVLAGSANISVTGNGSRNVIIGNAGRNWLDGRTGNDRLNGGDGVDNLLGGRGNDRLNGGAGFDYADYDNAAGAVRVNLATGRSSGADGIDTLRNIDGVQGSRFRDTLIGSASDNALEGRRGNDRLNGGAGFDYADYDNAAGAVRVNLATGRSSGADGIDTLRNIDGVRGSRFRDTLTGDGSANALEGRRGNDRLDGGLGIDTLIGGAGDDTYVIDTAQDVIVENAAGGIDTVESTVSYILTANLENLTLFGSAGINGIGNDLANQITGNAGANTLQGLGGADTLDGAGGNDTADYSEKTAAVVVALAGAADATVFVGGLPGSVGGGVAEDTIRNIENVRGGTAGDQLTGDGSANVLEGNDGNDRLDGGLGIDTLIGGAGDDTYVIDT